MTRKKIIKIGVIVLVVIIVILIVFFAYFYPRQVFKNNEATFDEAGKRYYQINQNYLPDQEGRVLAVSLGTLIRQDYLDDLKIPYSNKVCDLENSTVKVIKKDGEYQYYTYLKCGRYESNIDHEGPVITLNGNTKVHLNRGDEYKEEGIKSVIDDTDGSMKIEDVKISGEVDSSKVGEYEITYTINDSLNNKTTVTRTVIVEEALASVVKSATSNTNNYYKGLSDNNYVMFNNMLFRIVKVNDDDTVTIVSNESLSSVDYTNNGRFAGSSLDTWLNDYFYNLLEKKYQNLITSSTWCDDKLASDNYSATECSRRSEKIKVGILSIQDYNNTLDNNMSYLDSRALTWYANMGDDNKPWTLTSLYDYPLKAEPMNQEYLFNVRPALTLKKNTKVLSGDGTVNNPYILIETSKGRKNSNINEREVGEYINYSGYTWRIASKDNENVTIIMIDVLKNDDIELNIGYNNDGKKVYNPNQKGNIGYQIVNELTKYISTDLFAKTKVEVPIYNSNVTYKGKKSTKTYNNIITIPSVFDIFSAKGEKTSDGGYWYIDSSNENNVKTVMNPIGTVNYTAVTDERTAGVKVKAYLKNDVIITDGSGTKQNPYTISN